MAWLLLVAAIVLEVCGTMCMKLSAGFTKLVPSLLLFVFYVASFACLTFAVKMIDISIAYVIWAGLGTALIAVIGFWYFEVNGRAFAHTDVVRKLVDGGYF